MSEDLCVALLVSGQPQAFTGLYSAIAGNLSDLQSSLASTHACEQSC